MEREGPYDIETNIEQFMERRLDEFGDPPLFGIDANEYESAQFYLDFIRNYRQHVQVSMNAPIIGPVYYILTSCGFVCIYIYLKQKYQ